MTENQNNEVPKKKVVTIDDAPNVPLRDIKMQDDRKRIQDMPTIELREVQKSHLKKKENTEEK